MKNRQGFNFMFIAAIVVLHLLAGKTASAQIPGTLFMNQDNFYAQMFNPAYSRSDEAISVTLIGAGGLSFSNHGNFEIGELITIAPSGSPVIDYDNFYQHSKPNNIIRQDFAIPMLFVSFPLKDGNFSFYFKENYSQLLEMKKEAFEFLVSGNLPADIMNFNSGEVKMSGLGYREFAFGYNKKWKENIEVGIRSKLLFGAAMVNTNDWDYGLETAPNGSMVTLLSGGTGKLMLPWPYELRDDNSILSINADNAAVKYMSMYKNPGFAIDFGMNWHIDEKQFFSAAVRDIGAIWFRYNAADMLQNKPYDFTGFDLVSAIRYPEEPDFESPEVEVHDTKELIRMVYQPFINYNAFAKNLAPKTLLHYQYQYSEILSFAMTNQSTFYKNSFQSIFTVGAMQKWPNLSIFENLNLQTLSGVSLGGGIQYEASFGQLFLATDNLIAIYHPAANKSFNATFGFCFLINREKPDVISKSKNSKSSGGTTSDYLPFYKEKRNTGK